MDVNYGMRQIRSNSHPWISTLRSIEETCNRESLRNFFCSQMVLVKRCSRSKLVLCLQGWVFTLPALNSESWRLFGPPSTTRTYAWVTVRLFLVKFSWMLVELKLFVLQSGELTPAWLSVDDTDHFSGSTWPGHGFRGTWANDCILWYLLFSVHSRLVLDQLHSVRETPAMSVPFKFRCSRKVSLQTIKPKYYGF